MLQLDHNELCGAVPEEMFERRDSRRRLCEALVWLRLENNRLGGAVPPSLHGCHQLKELMLSDNSFKFDVPEGTAEEDGRTKVLAGLRHALPGCHVELL